MNTWRRLRQFLKTDLGLCLVVAVVWQLALTLIGWVVAGGTPLSHISSWDGGWYFTITHDWYQTNAPSAAFYPFFPLLVSAVHFVSFGVLSLDTSGLIINTIALWLGLVALTRIAPYFAAKQYRYMPVLFILAAPAAFLYTYFIQRRYSFA